MSRIHEAIRRAQNEALSNSIRGSTTPKEILQDANREIAQLRPILTGVPNESQHEQTTLPAFGTQANAFIDLRISPGSKLVSILAPHSAASQQYRRLKARLRQIKEGRVLKTILVTSAAALEGKTLTAVNVALTLAQEIDQKVLLVDAALDNPCVDRVLGISIERGLTDLLNGTLPASEIILSTTISNFYVALAGHIPENPRELLNKPSMNHFLTWARERFDWVILDSAPLAQLGDAHPLCSSVDGILLVVRSHQTPADVLMKNVSMLPATCVLGSIFNDVHNLKKSEYYYSQSYKLDHN